MININNSFLKDEKFISEYVEKVSSSFFKNEIIIKNKFFGDFESIIIDNDFLKFILIDPFENTSNDKNVNKFISMYLGVINYLLKSAKYFDYLKKNNSNLSTKERRLVYQENRKSIIENFNLISFYNIPLDTMKSNKKYMIQYNLISKEFDDLNKSISSIFNYVDIIDAEIRINILRNINVTICPYCNRQYIDFYRKNKKIRSVAQLDHFYPKKKFPLFSLTLANYIPSCAYCNTILKRDLMFPLTYPYGLLNNNEKIFEIEMYQSGIKTLYQPDDIDIMINNKSKFYQQLDFFHIKEIYGNHKIDVANLLNRKNLYNNSYKKALEHNLMTTISSEDFKIMLFGFSGEEEDLFKIPLSKLKHDIID